MNFTGHTNNPAEFGSLETIAALLDRVLPGGLAFDKQFIAGGALVRQFMKPREGDSGDIDLFCLGNECFRETLDALIAAGAMPTGKVGSFGNHQKVEIFGVVIDIVCTIGKDVRDVLGRFDLRCCAMAYDGHTLIEIDGAISDCKARLAFPLRPMLEARINSYLHRYWMKPHPEAPPLADRNWLPLHAGIRRNVPGWTLPDNVPWWVACGYGSDPHVGV